LTLIMQELLYYQTWNSQLIIIKKTKELSQVAIEVTIPTMKGMVKVA